MIKIQARTVVIPHTMDVCLIYGSMQAPGLFVPSLGACRDQGLFTFSPGLRKQAAPTFVLYNLMLYESLTVNAGTLISVDTLYLYQSVLSL